MVFNIYVNYFCRYKKIPPSVILGFLGTHVAFSKECCFYILKIYFAPQADYGYVLCDGEQ